MLYQIYEAQRSLMEPFADFAQAASKLYSNPLSPLGQSSLSQRMSAAYDFGAHAVVADIGGGRGH